MGKYFGTDGIRGYANQELTVETAFRIGRYIGMYYKGANDDARIVIGKDTRLSSDMLEAALAAGISASGSEVYLLGYCSTPCLAYVCSNEKFSVGAMISASHNPYYDNGIKLFGNDGIKIKDEVELKIEAYIDDPEGVDLATGYDIGRIYNYSEGVDRYCRFVRSKIDPRIANYNIILDLANGGSILTAKKIFEGYPNVTFINDDFDGININNHCGSTHLESLRQAILDGDYDIGFAYDGDADRCLALNSEGKLIDGDQLMYLLAKEQKRQGILRNDTLVVTMMSNMGLIKACKELDIACEVTAVGDKNVLDAMLSKDFTIGGEQSGHIINRHLTVFGDGVLSSVMVLNALCENSCQIDDLVEGLTIYPQLLKNVKVKDKKAVLADKRILDKMDEISATLKDTGRISVRASGTEPLVRVMVEAANQATCEKYVDQMIALITEAGYAL